MTEERPTAPEQGVAVVGGPVRGPATAGGDAAEPASTPAPTPRPSRLRSRTVAPRRPGGPAWMVPALVAVSVISVICAIVFGVKWSDATAQNDTRAAVQRVTKDFLNALFNFNAKTVDADFRTISTYATGDFAKQSNQFFGSSIRQKLETVQAWSRGQFRYLEVQSVDGNQASVYAWVDQTYANNKITQPIADVVQVVVNLTDVAGTWKVSDVTVLQPPNTSGTPTGNASGGG